MNNFLTETNERMKSNSFSTITIVLGNESCDLDSAVCALVYSYYLNWCYKKDDVCKCTKSKERELFLPILNVDRDDFPIKTEIVFCMKKYGVDVEQIIFRNDFNLPSLLDKISKCILVDHNVLSERDSYLLPRLKEIIDHRPIDPKWVEVTHTIELVGSCATLVSERVKKDAKFLELNLECAKLLYSTIILDTVNFCKQVNKGKEKDMNMVVYLEEILKIENNEQNRKSILEELVKARSDVSSLTVKQLLKKDLKIFGHVIVPSFPLLVEQLLKRPNLENDLNEVLKSNNCTIGLLLGMSLIPGDVKRDVAVYSVGSRENYQLLIKTMKEWTEPNLQLSEMESKNENISYFTQLNKSASRKQYVPIVNKFLSLAKC